MSDPQTTAVRSGARTTLVLLCLVSVFNYADRMLLAAVSHPIRQEFGLSDTQLGMLTGLAFASVYAGLAIPMGRLADRMSRKRLLAGCLAVWSLATAVMGFTTSFVQLAIARMLVAVGESGCTPTAYALLSDNFKARQRNFAHGLFNGASMLGVAIGFAFGGWVSQEYGWRAAFYWLGAPGVVLAGVILLVMKEPVRGATDEVAADPAPSTRVAIGALLRNRAFAFLLTACAFNSLGVYGISQWMPQVFIRVHGLSLAQVGAIFGVAFGLGMFAGNVLGGVLGNRAGRLSIGSPMIISVGASILIIPLYAAALLTDNVPLAVVLTTVSAVVGAAANPPAIAAGQNLTPANLRATSAALMLLAVALVGIGLGPVVVGMASDLLSARFGDNGLRYALVGLQAANIVAAIFYGLCGRHADRQAARTAA